MNHFPLGAGRASTTPVGRAAALGLVGAVVREAGLMARTLWDREVDFRAIAEDYYRAAFGADGPACLAYCAELSRLFDPPYVRSEKPRHDPATAETYARIPAVIEAFRPVIRRNLGAADPCHARSWHYLDVHADVCLHLAEALRLRAAGDEEGARRAWAATERFVQEREPDLHPALDVYEFTYVLTKFFVLGRIRAVA